MLILLLIASIFQIAHCSCPAGFELVRNGECRGKYAKVTTSWDNALDTAISKCKEIQGKPIIIHDDEHNSYWADLVPSSGFTVTGLACPDSGEWEWADGSKLDYKHGPSITELNENCETGWAWDIHADGGWNYGDRGQDTFHIFCTTQLQQPKGDGCDSFDDDTKDGICYQVRGNAQSWQEAQTTCRNLGGTVASIHNLRENQFIRKNAVSQGAVNGLYIGATSSGNKFAWIDGSPWDYQHFYPGFPIAGHGECLAIDTFSNSGEWMNMDCNSKLGVACAKKAEPRHACTGGPWLQSEVIYSPGFPYDASIPCDYFLTVPPGKKVRVEVLLLEANTCCDRLVMEDDVLGGNLVANLTGEISNQYYTTSSSNFMRVSWQPHGGVNVRGAMFTFTAV